MVEYVYQIPTSNPNGIVDLETSYVGVGDSSGLTDSLEKNDSGVLFFEVKNIGTKTSDDWRFTVSLPDNQTYTSERQLALKPNERATLALTMKIAQVQTTALHSEYSSLISLLKYKLATPTGAASLYFRYPD